MSQNDLLDPHKSFFCCQSHTSVWFVFVGFCFRISANNDDITRHFKQEIFLFLRENSKSICDDAIIFKLRKLTSILIESVVDFLKNILFFITGMLNIKVKKQFYFILKIKYLNRQLFFQE